MHQIFTTIQLQTASEVTLTLNYLTRLRNGYRQLYSNINAAGECVMWEETILDAVL